MNIDFYCIFYDSILFLRLIDVGDEIYVFIKIYMEFVSYWGVMRTGNIAIPKPEL